ncbi:MAG: acyl-CoA thioesterase [Chloroflexota bacterium]
MTKIFSRTFRVRWSELNANCISTGQISPANYLRYLVETAYDWGDALGLGADQEDSFGLYWLIRETQFNILGTLGHNELFDFTIWMINWQRVRGTRCFEIKTRDTGRVIIQGTQQIVCMDISAQRPTTPPLNIIENFRIADPIVFPFQQFPKVSPENNKFSMQRQVEWQDLDAQEHVNNAVYLNFAEEAAAREMRTFGWDPHQLSQKNLALSIKRVHIQYQSPAVWGENLNISIQHLSVNNTGGSRYFKMNRTDGTGVAECILDWSLVDRASGNEVDLPADLISKLRQAG